GPQTTATAHRETPMKDARSDTGNREMRLCRLLDDYLAAARTGAAPNPERLLAEHADLADDLREGLASPAFIRQAAAADAAAAAEPAAAEGAGWTLGDFRILRETGRGGRGVVCEA